MDRAVSLFQDYNLGASSILSGLECTGTFESGHSLRTSIHMLVPMSLNRQDPEYK